MPMDPRTGLEMPYPPAQTFPYGTRAGAPLRAAPAAIPPNPYLQGPQSGLGLPQATPAARPVTNAAQLARAVRNDGSASMDGQIDPEYLQMIAGGAQTTEGERQLGRDEYLADYLGESSLTPRGRERSWTQGAARVMQAYAARQRRGEAKEEGSRLAEERAKYRQQFLDMLNSREADYQSE